MSLTDDQQGAWRSLVMLAHVLEESLDRQSRRDGGVPHTYYKLLVFLYEAEGRRIAMSALAAQLRYSSSRLTHALASLERSGWARRIRSNDDRRVQFVELTYEGAAVVKRVTPGQVAEIRERVFEGMSPADVVALRRLATAAVANLEGSVPAAGGPPASG